MVSKEFLKDFYKKTEFILKPNPQWRTYKFKLKSGRWITLYGIRDEETLRKYAIKYLPTHIYSTVSCFLNPKDPKKHLRGEGYKVADSLLIDQMIFIDLDGEEVRKAPQIIDFFKKHNLPLWKIVHSGGGLHLYFRDPVDLPANPYDRVPFIETRRAFLLKLMEQQGITLDPHHKNLFTDVYRVSRVIGSYNSSWNKPCCVLEDFSPETLKHLKFEHKVLKGMKNISPQSNEGAGELGLATPSLYKFVMNSVNGTKGLFVPFFIWKKKFFKKGKLDLESLNGVVLWELGHYVYALALKTCDFRRTQKLLKKFKSLNYKSFSKYHYSRIPTSSLLTGDKLVKKKFIGFVGHYDSKSYYSRPHYSIFKDKIPRPPNLVGKERNPVFINYETRIIRWSKRQNATG